MTRNDGKQSTPKKQDTLREHQPSRTNQDRYSGQEGTNPSGNQDQFNIDGVEGQYGSSQDQPGPFDSEDLYHTTSSQRSSSLHGQKQKQKWTDN